ncbi:hypothetical protein CRM22_004426 [Opisthorchis felineus]|uniref:Uncharacterized protein n=1 Tax=Opisthorchis felineus TaxID=147828 RepID=A0A4S2LW71_OPIFE|nr:hypothetical protein CRM22_004426 [Opisthorchis felineus]
MDLPKFKKFLPSILLHLTCCTRPLHLRSPVAFPPHQFAETSSHCPSVPSFCEHFGTFVSPVLSLRPPRKFKHCYQLVRVWWPKYHSSDLVRIGVIAVVIFRTQPGNHLFSAAYAFVLPVSLHDMLFLKIGKTAFVCLFVYLFVICFFAQACGSK